MENKGPKSVIYEMFISYVFIVIFLVVLNKGQTSGSVKVWQVLYHWATSPVQIHCLSCHGNDSTSDPHGNRHSFLLTYWKVYALFYCSWKALCLYTFSLHFWWYKSLKMKREATHFKGYRGLYNPIMSDFHYWINYPRKTTKSKVIFFNA